MERAYIECQRKKGNHPLLNMRAGEGTPSRAKGRNRKTKDCCSGGLTLYLVAALIIVEPDQ